MSASSLWFLKHFLKKDLFIYFWLHWVFMAAHELSSVAKLAIPQSLLLEQEYLRGSSGYLEGLWALELDLTLTPNLIHSKNHPILYAQHCYLISVQFSSVAQSCPTLCDPMNCSTPGLPVHHQLPESTQTHVHCVGDAIQPSHPLSSPSPPALNLSQHQGLFQ